MIKEKLLQKISPDLDLERAQDILKTKETGLRWVSQANSIELENNEVKIKQPINLNLNISKDI